MHDTGMWQCVDQIMNSKINILFTKNRPKLIEAITSRHPDAQVTIIGKRTIDSLTHDRLISFVDWVLPDISGLEICHRLKANGNTAHGHITMVLEGRDEEIQRRALRAGADDYVFAPLMEKHVFDKLGTAHLSHNSRPNILKHGDLLIDLAAFKVQFQGKTIPLAPNEYRLLCHFMENPDKLFGRRKLIELLGKSTDDIDERVVDVWIGRLRRSLKVHNVPDILRTVRSLGYVLDSY
jgi:two-component system, OmpR family, phosphate regulon response regulator PhoB